ncbi:MAG: NADPH-dependent 7-cyano-7-deazaguanine reductase QueF [Oceanospirillales bacterium]|uniref:NADPH-dependent 7-cyano-7-deazaguanine reductase n=1 Tax=Marinobacterium halophilum TaxID=267374 RepID=A0A2P8ETW9_9GAMM|nr:NADPH-dependent 7-cyano-7-deazaguanine reductase QueF [Marinobacterium halophilum]MBR9829485.1 NADPH-dependent 7-cyano-7-deazaguanine reductase QueF [Oceanospirillales bacterium]PSL12921.1 7-cyano-7-deazaguanine reductase [Marinobacterium halophilum]
MSEHEQVKASPLGQETAYVNEYDASLLYPIARDLNWAAKGVKRAALPFRGLDIWNAYEVSWLDRGGKPVVRLAEFRIPASSPHIIESKSFKLYLNSYNLSRFGGEADVRERMTADLSAVAGAPVEVILTSLTAPVEVVQLKGRCLDELPLQVEHYTPAPELLTAGGAVQDEILVSHLLKSNCPVTGQPDWASVQIRYKGPQIDQKGLLAYLISYREHGDFHEQCVENIFMDIWQRCRPQKLSVYARYVRRGGLDINPYRSSINDVPQNLRLSRQ